MAANEIKIPSLGEGVTEATIIRWLKKEGDLVKEDEAIVEIATDKVDSEIYAPVSGILEKILFNEKEVVAVGTVIAIISDSKENTVEKANTVIMPEEAEQNSNENISCTTCLNEEEEKNISQKAVSSERQYYSPLIRNIAKQENISFEELDKIKGTGSGGRLTRRDLQDYLEKRNTSKKPTPIPKAAPSQILSGEDEIIEMDRVRRLIAEHLLHSVQTAPHVTSFLEVDVSKVVRWRNKVKDIFQAREKEKFTLTPVFIDVVARALKEFPMLNSSVDGNKIILKRRINIGIATALPNGNLIVPVIKDVPLLSISGIAKKLNDLAHRARENKLLPDEIAGGTFSITNLGTFGTDYGTPIINQPQVAILGLGAIRRKPVVIQNDRGEEFIAIRDRMVLSLAFDHRIIDGYLAGMFLKKVEQLLDNWNEDIEI